MASLSFEPATYDDLDPERRPTLRQALVPVLGIVLSLGIGSGYLKLAPHAPLLWSIVLTAAVGTYWLGYSWDDIYEGIAQSLLTGLQSILLLFVIYALIATWIAAGTIPGLMRYGLSLLTPTVFLPVTALLAGVVAFAIGSSWTTAGTLGVAFVGIGSGLGIPVPMTAGAILSGAYAGDKQSPLSDTTNLAAAVTDTDLYHHIRGMRNGTVIAFALAIALYAALGLRAGGTIPAGRVADIQAALAGTYDLTPLVFVPLVVTFGLALAGYPALPTLVAGVFTAVATIVLVQGAAFTTAWTVFLNGTNPSTGLDVVDGLLASGVLAVLAHEVAEAVTNRRSLVASTGVSAIVVNVFSAQQYMSIVVPGMTLRNLYDEYDLDSADLSRAIESAGTPTGALIPWHAGSVYMAGVLGVAPWAGAFGLAGFAPYYFFAFLSPLVLFASTLFDRGFVTNANVDGRPTDATLADD